MNFTTNEYPNWLAHGLRDIKSFPPPTRVTLLCRRNLEWEISPGQKERRDEFTVDKYNGKQWGREGTGKYVQYSTIPPVGMMHTLQKQMPPIKRHFVADCTHSKYFGAHITKMIAPNPTKRIFQIQLPYSGDWVDVPPSYIAGWFPLL